MTYKKNILASLILLAFSCSAFGQLTILSGSKQSSQYRYIQDIATIVGPSLGFKVVNKESFGAAYNTDQLMDPASPYKVALIQCDYLYYMQAQDMQLSTSKTKNLKVLVPMGYEQIHLVTRASKGYKGLKDLEKKVVAIGSSSQGTYRTALLIHDRSKVDFSAKNTHFNDAFSELNTGRIDAFFVVSSAPIPKLNMNPQSMVDKLALVPLEDFNDWAKYYKPDVIHKSDYKWLDADVPTFSVQSVLVVNESKLSDAEREQVKKLKAAIESEDGKLKEKGHPNWKVIDLADWKESDWPSFK